MVEQTPSPGGVQIDCLFSGKELSVTLDVSGYDELLVLSTYYFGTEFYVCGHLPVADVPDSTGNAIGYDGQGSGYVTWGGDKNSLTLKGVNEGFTYIYAVYGIKH